MVKINKEIGQSIITAITGGIGSGKTTVAKYFAESGFPVIYTDNIARDIMHENALVKQSLIALFGNDAYNDDGKINGQLISSKVFGSSIEHHKALLDLNKIVHPPVIDEMIRQIELKMKSGSKLIFVESALVFEAGIDGGFDYIIVVDAPKEIRIQRVMERSGISADNVNERIKSQIPLSEKVKQADFVIDNSGDAEKMKKSAELVLNILLNLNPKSFHEN